MSNPKVFEFAKEIGMTPLALMDKIREWHLPVKSHMAELDPGTLEAIKAKLNEKSAPAAAATEKKVAARKKAPAPAQAPVKAATPASAKAAAPVTPTAAKPAGGTVVRRKKAEEPVKEVKAEEPIVDQPVASSPAAPVVPVPPIKEIPAAVSVAPAAPAPATAAPAAASTPVVSAEAIEESVEKRGPPRKKEVAIGNSGVASSAPKRNIIGRMDLSRVATVAPSGGGRPDRGPHSGPRPAGGATSGGFASTRPGGKGNLRAGFVAPVSIPDTPGFDEEYERKKEEKRRTKGGAIEAAAPKVSEEEENQHFDAAEFRKREMVFQPKKKKNMLARPAMQTQKTQPKASKRVVKVNKVMKVGDLAMAMGMKAAEIIKVLMKNGVMATVNQDLDFETIALLVPEFGFEAQNEFRTAEELLTETAFGELNAEKEVRPPVVCVMGHVDHGKTSLLDAIRNAKVAEGEAGGITQHIGAYQVKTESGKVVTFLDTPGHEAFTSMRSRGANVTDIAIIVVAADDGVMPQTAEAISHAKAAGVPMIVAVNKMDKPGANPDRVKQQLTEYEVVPEEWGGTTIFCNVSALKRTGISELLEQVLLVAEVAELKANAKRSGTGTVIEARLEKGRGNVATVLVKDGSISVGQYIVAGTQTGRVRSLMNDRGEKVQTAGPSQPVEVIGLDGLPLAGDKVDVVKDERAAEEVAGVRRQALEAEKVSAKKMTLEDLFSKVTQGDVKELPVVLKADVQGSLEAITGMFNKLAAQEVKVKIIHSAAGGITESDVLLASTAKGIVVGFNVRPDGGATTAAKVKGVEIRTYSIVYELMDEMKKAMSGLLQPDIVEKVMGRAEVRNTFSVPKIGVIAGCAVVDGKIQRSNSARLIRDGKIVYEGKISSLKRFKDDAREVAEGFECGIGIENFNDIKVGDVIEAFLKEEVARELTPLKQPEA
ncbi:MAG: translation initiation factor IF-2 [Pseudobdellovibrionaceae bacterium]